MRNEDREYQTEAVDKVIKSTIGQVILPTASGKSVIQSKVLSKQLKKDHTFNIYVVATPRILLTNQLMVDVTKPLLKAGFKVATQTIHSGKNPIWFEEGDVITDAERSMYVNLASSVTTNTDDIVITIKQAKQANLPLIVCVTYDSIPTLVRALEIANCRVKQVLCDEAHYIVEKTFNENVKALREFADRIHFFTATQKITASDNGTGMNNVRLFGEVVYRKTVAWMIKRGYIIRPRIHYEKAPANTPWTTMVSDAFATHQSYVGYDAKMLVCCDGNKTINSIRNDRKFLAQCKEDGVTLFSISAETGARINNVELGRDKFLKELKNHEGKAIILHINILTEGIDVPDISGVMFIRNMGLTRFLQSIGRALRKHKGDYDKSADTYKSWIKPYAWAIIAEREGDEDKTASLESVVFKMRQAGFEPFEEHVVAVDLGTNEKKELDVVGEQGKKVRSLFAKLFAIQHTIESEESAKLFNEQKEALHLRAAKIMVDLMADR